MTGTLTIAARELRERSFVFVTAAMLALVPFIAALIPITRNTGPGFVIMIVGAVVSTGLAFGLAITLGRSFVGTDLSERRLSFYFSKPVSASAIWFGKIIGVFATVAICFAITFLPAFVVAYNKWQGTTGVAVGGFIAVVVGGALYFLLVAHGVSTVIRSRSPLVALDLSLFASAVAVVWLIVRPLVINGALELVAAIVQSMVIMLPLTILAGGAWQLSRGRTDIRRSHRELSKFFWCAMAVAIAIVGGYVAWVLSAGPRDLVNIGAETNARGDWMVMTGSAKHRGDFHPTFLVDLKNGERHRVAGGRRFGRVDFTRRGDAATMVVPFDRADLKGELHVQRLDGQYSDDATGITAGIWSPAVLSDDLSRAVLHDSVISVYDLKTKALLASVKLPQQASYIEHYFVTNDLIRIIARTSGNQMAKESPLELRIYEFNVRTRQLVQTGSFSSVAKFAFDRMNADGSLLVLNEYLAEGPSKTHLLDGRTAAERAVLPGRRMFSVLPLEDGGLAYVDASNGSSSLVIADQHGNALKRVAIGSSKASTVREVIPGKIYVVNLSDGRPTQTGAGWSANVVDVERGAVVRVERDALVQSQLMSGDPRVPPANTTGEYVIADAYNTFWRWNALTGAKTKLF